MASSVIWHMMLDITDFNWPMVPPLPSKSQRQSLSTMLSYSQLSFHTEHVPISRTFSFNISFHTLRVTGLVKSAKTPLPPHQVPIPGSSLWLSFTKISFAFICSRLGWERRIPGFTFGDTVIPLFFICAKKSLGFLKRFSFHVNTQRFTPCSVS